MKTLLPTKAKPNPGNPKRVFTPDELLARRADPTCPRKDCWQCGVPIEAPHTRLCETCLRKEVGDED